MGATYLKCAVVYTPSLARDFPNLVSIFACACDLLGSTIDTMMSKAVPITLLNTITCTVCNTAAASKDYRNEDICWLV